MSPRDQFVENFEDAFMSLFMADIAEYEGQKFIEENERLKNDPNFKVPPELDCRCIRTINNTERKKRIRSTGKKIYRVFSQISVAAVIALMLFTSAYAAFPSVRAATLNLLIQVSDVATEFTFANESNEPSVTSIPSDSALYADMDIAGYVLPDSITSNYELTDKGSDQAGSWVLFKGADDALIAFEVQQGKKNAVYINTENAVNSETINISQFQSVISQQESGVVIGGIADSSKINFILVTFEGVDFESSLVMIEDFLNENLEGTK
ncbi:MAG: hypothetical protein ACLUGA_08710 [Oscillospiraceae bacterium]